MSDPRDLDDDERSALGSLREDLDALRVRHLGDPPLDLLQAARAGALPDPPGDAVAEHLEKSGWSRALAAAADALDDEAPVPADRVLARIRAGSAAPRPQRHAGWIWVPALAAAAIVILAVVLSRPAPTAPESADARSAQVGPAAPAAGAAPAASPARFRLPLEKPDVRFTAAALVLRGEGQTPARFVDAAAPAVSAFRAGDFAAAAREFAALQPRYQTSVEVSFYLGVSRLFLGSPEEARAALEAARRHDDGSFAENIGWYLAVADERAGRTADARSELDRLCGGGGPQAPRACAAAKAFAAQ
ncbi:MAG TPA: hypothetical protein VL309_11990 [Vicinamibacterales bacterium]|nr:hypothetical protein [Vicinamibacterales bacterium]